MRLLYLLTLFLCAPLLLLNAMENNKHSIMFLLNPLPEENLTKSLREYHQLCSTQQNQIQKELTWVKIKKNHSQVLCSICFQYINSYALRYHVLTHYDVPKFYCHICKVGYANEHYFNEHQKKHK